MMWGKVDYTNPDNQLKIMKQFEDIVESEFITQTDTERLWIADFNLWTTRQCTQNFDSVRGGECGADQTYIGDAADNSSACEGTWVENKIGLKTQKITSVLSTGCDPFKGGICRPSTEMFKQDLDAIGASDTDGKSYCPVFDGWSEDKLKFCVQKWREYTGGGGGILVEEGTATPFSEDGVKVPGEFIKDDEIISPIPLSSSPTMYATKLISHQVTVNMIKETRTICDNDKELHCFMTGELIYSIVHSFINMSSIDTKYYIWQTGIPFDFWEQYLTVDSVLLKLSIASVATGFLISAVFLFWMLNPADPNFGTMDKIIASVSGGLLIALTIILCLVPVIGISLIADVSLTAFSNMAFVLSAGFATE